MWNCMPSMQTCRLTVTTHTRSYTLLIVCWLYQAKSTLICIPRALLCLQWLMALFLYFILSTILSLSILLFPIACSFWFRENCQACTIESFLFFPFLFSFCSPHRTLLSHPLTSLSILHSSPSKLSFLTKGAPRLSQTGVEKGSAEINKFHPRGSRRFCPPPLLSAPSNLTRTLHRKPVKQSKPICRKLFYFSPPACLKQDLLLMDSPLPTCTVSVVDLAKLRAHAVLYSTLVTKCNSVFFSGSIVDSGRALHHQYAQLPTPYFKSKISPERKWMCWFICLRRPDLKTILISLVGRRGAHGIKMEVVFSCLFI